MKTEKYIKLGECAICPYSDKTKDKDLLCHWSRKNPEKCVDIKECGHFPYIPGDIADKEL